MCNSLNFLFLINVSSNGIRTCNHWFSKTDLGLFKVIQDHLSFSSQVKVFHVVTSVYAYTHSQACTRNIHYYYDCWKKHVFEAINYILKYFQVEIIHSFICFFPSPYISHTKCHFFTQPHIFTLISANFRCWRTPTLCISVTGVNKSDHIFQSHDREKLMLIHDILSPLDLQPDSQ